MNEDGLSNQRLFMDKQIVVVEWSLQRDWRNKYQCVGEKEEVFESAKHYYNSINQVAQL